MLTFKCSRDVNKVKHSKLHIFYSNANVDAFNSRIIAALPEAPDSSIADDDNAPARIRNTAMRAVLNAPTKETAGLPTVLKIRRDIRYMVTLILNSLNEDLLKLVNAVWQKEEVPQAWNEAIIVPVFKKGDKIKAENYRGIALLDVGYKVFSTILNNRLKPVTEEAIGDYQSGFRKNRSTSTHIFTLSQILEKNYEYNKNVHIVFVDFKSSYY